MSDATERIDERTEAIMAQIDDLNTALQTLQTGVTDLSTRVTSDLNTLKQELQNQQNSGAPDLTGAIATVTNLQQAVAGIDPAQTPPAPPAA